MRIGGIASGIDTESMIKDLMRAERGRLNRFFRQEESLKWRRDALNNINKNVANFIINSRRDWGLTQVTSTGTILNSSANNLTWVKNAISSNEGVLSATARSNAINGTHEVEITNLAKVANTTSQRIFGNNPDTTDLLNSSLAFKDDGAFTITTNVGTATINIEANESISSVISKINNASENGKNLGLRAAFDKELGQLMISTRDTGVDKTIKVESNALTQSIFSGAILTTGITGEDAKIKFNGSEIEKSTNSFTIFGVDLNLKAETNPGEKITINVGTNVEGIIEKIKSFIDSYNSIIDEVNGKINEKSYRDYFPLVKEEKEAMSEKEIEQWEERAKSGLLKNNEVLNRTLQALRNDIYKTVEGVDGSYNHITQIGITTGYYKDGGKLVIDESKLRDAVINDPEGVINLFFKTPTSTATGEQKTKETGLVQRIYDGFIDGMKEVIRQSGTGEEASLFRSVQSNILIDFVITYSSISVIDKDLSDVNSRIAREERILISRENSYWKRFTAMEKAMSQMNSQSSWLMAQLGLGQ